MAKAQRRPHFYLALAPVSLVLAALLPHAAAALSGSTNTARRHKHHHEDQAAPAPSPGAGTPPTTRVHHARSATSYPFNGDFTFADLRQNCAAVPFRRLARILYGPHVQQDVLRDIYCVVRTIEGSQPIMKWTWRAAVVSGGDVCYVEVGIMDDDNLRADCPEWTCVRRCTLSRHDALELAIKAISTACGGATTTTTGVTSSASPFRLKLNAALPLLAIVLLPRPLAAAVVLAYLPRLVRADRYDDEEFLKLNHATCAVYPYDNATGIVERSRPVPGLREICLRPLCFDSDASERTLSVVHAEHHGRFDDPLRVYCAVHSLEGASSPSIFFPWRNTWRAHLPLADPASGNDVCYVELAHMDYREGYYISCPSGHAGVSCTEFPEEPVAAAVWEHRKLTYLDNVGNKWERYMYGQLSRSTITLPISDPSRMSQGLSVQFLWFNVLLPISA